MVDQPESSSNRPVKPSKGRSPSYPGIPLGTAVQRTERLYDVLRDRPGRVDAILSHWGYRPGSGAGLVTLAALKKFGLLADEGSGKARQARLTPWGVHLGVDRREDSAERRKVIQQAALAPKVHREIWDLYSGHLPDDDALIIQLQLERSFTPHGAKEFVDQFRKTISYAQLSASDRFGDNEGDTEDRQDATVRPESVRTRIEVPQVSPVSGSAIVLPLGAGGGRITIEGGPFPAATWEEMLRALQAIGSLVTAQSSTPDDEGYQD